MKFYNSMTLANAVLKHVKRILRPVKGSIAVYPYSNCRENGWHLWNWDNGQRVSFSEHRNVDRPVVYLGALGWNP